MQDISFLRNDLVLVGGGHSHLALLRRLCMRPRDDIRVTLVSESSYALYSGMIPGTIAGYYKVEQACIDLRKLCQAGKVRLLIDSAIGIDSQRQELNLAMRPALRYDVLSINCGSRPALTAIDGADRFGIAVKPLALFLAQVAELVRDIDRHPRACRITIVGGGAAAVEAHRLHALRLLPAVGSARRLRDPHPLARAAPTQCKARACFRPFLDPIS